MEFRVIYNQYKYKIYRICLGYVNNPEVAKDLTQETFISIWQNLDSFRNDSDILTWMYRIATNKCLRSIEYEKRKNLIEKQLTDVDLSKDENYEHRRVLLRQCIAELPEVQRIIMTLYLEKIPQEKIAEITGLSHANVRVRIHRIKERLLKKIKDHGKI